MSKKKKKKKKGRKVRVEFRANRSQPAREKDWTRRYQEHGFEDQDTIARRGLNPKGELTRKRTIIEEQDPQALGLREGRVLSMRGLIAEVDDGARIWPCTIRRVLRTRRIDQRHPVAVGDRVRFAVAADQEGLEREGVIHEVCPRRSQLTRRYAERVHVIAANVDQVLIVASAAEPPLKPHLIDRYLVAAHAGNIHPLICINKVDLGNEEQVASVVGMYLAIGYRTVLASVPTGQGVAQLQKAFKDQETVVVGQSGVGKSSLLNAIQPGLQLATSEVSEGTAKGKHTTTASQLIKLELGGYVVDTPGIRSYDLAVIPANEYELHFTEFADHVPHCKFPDCTHIHEQGCAVKDAVERGLIDVRRLRSYQRMYEEG